MTNDEQEFQKFMTGLANKVEEVKRDYNKLSDNNKRRVQEHFKPIMDTGSFLWLFGNKK